MRLCRALLFGVGLSICAQAAWAQDHRRVEFDIAAQAIDGALDRFAAASGFQVFYETALTAGHHSQSIKGMFDATAALHLLLEGSGLTGKFIGPNTITITRASDIGPALLSAASGAVSRLLRCHPGCCYGGALPEHQYPAGVLSGCYPILDRPGGRGLTRATHRIIRGRSAGRRDHPCNPNGRAATRAFTAAAAGHASN